MTTEGSPMCGSRIEPDGRVIVTTPSLGCRVGDALYVIGSAADFATPRADWVERLLCPPADSNGRPWGTGVESTAAAEEALRVRLGLTEIKPRVETPALEHEAAA